MRYLLSWNEARVRATRDLPGGVRMLEIEPAEGARSYPPGSHIEVRVVIDGEEDVRHYSLVGDHPVDGAYRIAVSHHPDSRGGSEYMRALEPGDRLAVSDPQNLFPLSYGSSEYLLVAGGIGITPVLDGVRARATRRTLPDDLRRPAAGGHALRRRALRAARGSADAPRVRGGDAHGRGGRSAACTTRASSTSAARGG